MHLLGLARPQDVLAELQQGGVLHFHCLVHYFEELLDGEVFNVPGVGGEVDGQPQQLDGAYVGMGGKDEFDHVVHAVGVGEGEPHGRLSR